MVSGVRVKRQDTASRRLASRLGNGFRNAMLGDGATDTGCGLKAFRRDAFLDLPYFDHMHRFLIALMQREGWKVAYVPVNHRPRLTGASKYTNFGRLLVSVQDLLGVRWLQRRHRGRSRDRGAVDELSDPPLSQRDAPIRTTRCGTVIGFAGQARLRRPLPDPVAEKRKGGPQRHSHRLLVLQPGRRRDHLFLYAVHLQAWPLVLGQGLPLPIYARNIWMIYRDRGRAGPARLR